MWEKVAEAQVSSDGVHGDILTAISEIPKGAVGRIVVSGPLLGPVFDAAGVELAIQAAFDRQGIDAQVVDAWGEGWNTGYIQFTGSPIPLVPLLWAIAAVLAALGVVAVIVTISILLLKVAAAGPSGAAFSLLLVAGATLGGIYLWSKRKGK